LTNPAHDLLRPAAQRGPDASALEFFARVAGAGSFAAAARRLGLTRAGVSQRIAQIEAAVGVPLFARSTRALGLTEAGRRLLARARAVHEAAEAARRSLRSGADARAGGSLTGTLRLTTAPVFGQAVLAPLLASFQGLHPELRIEMRFTLRSVDLVREDIDLAFRLTRRPPEHCIAQPVLPFAVRACAAPAQGAPVHPKALAARRCLVFGPASDTVPATWLHPSSQERATVEIAPAMVADDLGSLLAVARAGGGVVFAPDFAVADDLKRGTLVDVMPGWQLDVAQGDAVMAITLALDVAPAAARALVHHVRAALGTGEPRAAGGPAGTADPPAAAAH
jgi:DNA-binding transcriptional LysR family regulator